MVAEASHRSSDVELMIVNQQQIISSQCPLTYGNKFRDSIFKLVGASEKYK